MVSASKYSIASRAGFGCISAEARVSGHKMSLPEQSCAQIVGGQVGRGQGPTKVRGQRKPCLHTKACKAPHPLPPIVRRRSQRRAQVVSTRAGLFGLLLVRPGSVRRIPYYLQTPAGSATLHDHAPVRLLAVHNAPKPAPRRWKHDNWRSSNSGFVRCKQSLFAQRAADAVPSVGRQSRPSAGSSLGARHHTPSTGHMPGPVSVFGNAPRLLRRSLGSRGEPY
jgi:hypothetical protein